MLLDVRESNELNDDVGHIEGVLNIPIRTLTQNISKLGKYKEIKIVVICRFGGRSHTATQILTKAGFAKVSS